MYILDGYRPDDVTELWAIEQECFPRGLRWNAKQFKGVLKSSLVWVAYEGPFNYYPVGFLVSWVDRGTPHIASIGVRKANRGEGIGTRLIQKAEEFYGREHDAINLNVRAENPAQQLYFRLGYRTCGFRKGILKMQKDLSPREGR